MKKQITKIISVVLIFVISALVLSSCAYIDAYVKEHIIQPRPENEMYGAFKMLYSYEETMDAIEIVRERVEVAPTYTVKDMGDEYTVLYQFSKNGIWTEYPIDYETYFGSVSTGHLSTYIIFNDLECPGHTNPGDCVGNFLRVNKYDEDYDRITGYWYHAGVRVVELRYVEIEDKSLLSYQNYGQLDTVYYDGVEIINLYSCVELDEDFFEVFFNSLVTTSVE